MPVSNGFNTTKLSQFSSHIPVTASLLSRDEFSSSISQISVSKLKVTGFTNCLKSNVSLAFLAGFFSLIPVLLYFVRTTQKNDLK